MPYECLNGRKSNINNYISDEEGAIHNKIHTFQSSLKVGQEGERILDAYFSHKFTISEVTKEWQLKGIDREFLHKKNNVLCTVEYKTDVKEGTTGNVFIEIWSNKQESKRGWAFTSLAQWLYFYLPSSQEVCTIEMTKMKMGLKKWQSSEYKVAQCVNRVGNTFYTSEGILVPSDEFKKICHEVICLSIRKGKK